MKRVKLSDVAERAGVSAATVSRAINNSGYVAEDVRRRIDNAMEETGYIRISKNLNLHNVKLIGVISPYGGLSLYLGKLAYSLQLEAEKNGYYCINVTVPALDNAALAYHAERLSALGVSGLVICSFNADFLECGARTALHRCGVPVVFLERAAGCYGFNRVLVDNELGTFSAARYLLEKGRRSIAYISYNRNSAVELSRKKGFIKAIEQEAGDSVNYRIFDCTEITPRAAIDAMRDAASEMPDITGVVAWNDVYALGALSFFQGQGCAVPNEVEIIGYDNILAPDLPVPISSVAMPVDEIVSAAIEIIDKCVNQKTPPSPRTITLEPRLIIR